MATAKTKTIDGKKVVVTQWGFLTMMPIKRKFLNLISKTSGDIAELANSFQKSGEFGEVDIASVVQFISGILENLDEETFMWFVRSILKNVVIDEVAMNNDKDIDEVLTGEMVTFYKIVAFVMEVNFGDFFETLKTLLDSSAPLDFVEEA